MTYSFPYALRPDLTAQLRQRRLNWRMRVVAASGITAAVAVLVLAAQAYATTGFAAAVMLFAVGATVLIMALRDADRHFIAPLQALCQEDFNRRLTGFFAAARSDAAGLIEEEEAHSAARRRA